MSTRYNSPYVPTYLRSSVQDAKPVQLTYSDFDLSDTNVESSDSFKYDPLGYPLKSTQQLNVDWSKFENHCFFSSAEVKVNEAFNKIINGYPFDGSKKEVEAFLDSLTGFEKWVFDRFPSWSGSLKFSGSSGTSPQDGTWISVEDKAGTLFPELSKNNTGKVTINPGDETSMSIEALVFLPEMSNGTQVLFQKRSSAVDAFTLYLEPSVSSTSTNAVFSITSGSNRNYVSSPLVKGRYNHICVVLNKEDAREHVLQFYRDELLVSESISRVKFNKLNVDSENFLIGSGSSFYNENTLVVPNETFSGSLDELRIFHSVRSPSIQKLYATKGLYASPDLKLYYRFNEPSGSLSFDNNVSIDSIVLDSSGNSLHSNINNFSLDLRCDNSKDSTSLMSNERAEFKKVLFPAYSSVTSLNLDLLSSASLYDSANPNMIMKLIPQHYLLEGAFEDGFKEIEGNGGIPYSGEGIPGQGKRGSVQIILTFLYIWSKFFDEMKTYIDSFATLRTVGYDTNDTVPDNFLEDLVRSYGFYLPKFFSHSTVEQFSEGQNIEGLSSIDMPLKVIQTTILRRVLTNMNDIVRSKGTQHSIRSFLRSVGIDPENSLRIREYGGPTVKQLKESRETRIEPGAMVEFTGSSLVISKPLSGSRIEPGYPAPRGNFLKNSDGTVLGTDYVWDGLYTSGSWTLEGTFKFTNERLKLISDKNEQSLFRMIVTGSSSGSGPGLVANVVATQFSDYPRVNSTVQAFLRPGMTINSPLLHMSLDLGGYGIFDGDKWNVELGCIRGDEINSNSSSSYYLRVAKNDQGEIQESYVTSSFFLEDTNLEKNVFRTGSIENNVSGTYVCIGENQSIPTSAGSYLFLNDTTVSDPIARTTQFLGWASNVRFWSKSMSESEWKEHVRNPKSVGVDNPLINYNYVNKLSGSFQKLRMDTLTKQQIKDADNVGSIEFLDFSQNDIPMAGSGFVSGSRVLKGDLFNYSYLSPTFDESSTSDKVRVRSFNSEKLVEENPSSVFAPTYLSDSFFLQEEPQDDLRLSIEFSMVDSLDKDIVNMFSSLDFLGDVLGSPEMQFSPDYPDLENLRDVYFNRLSAKPDFRKFLEFYRWFDISISSFIEQLIPSKTLYKGTNYVIESHMLERHKHQYKHYNNYLGEKRTIEDSLLVQQIVGRIKKY
jgi:hypothetical protein